VKQKHQRAEHQRVKHPPYIVLLGAPGAGKGTQAAALAKTLGIAHVSSGDLFRDNLKRGTELGRLARGYMNKGELVPDEVTIQMVIERLSRSSEASGAGGVSVGAILDGFPRTLAQAKALDEALAELERALDLVPLIQVGDEEVMRRLTGRRVCRACGAVYHLLFNPPKVEGSCDVCGGELYQRDDDSPDTVRHRLYTYYKETGPLIGYYYAHDLLVEIDGERAIDAVQADLVRAVRSRGPSHGDNK
jgi:adenylate kinase